MQLQGFHVSRGLVKQVDQAFVGVNPDPQLVLVVAKAFEAGFEAEGEKENGVLIRPLLDTFAWIGEGLKGFPGVECCALQRLLRAACLRDLAFE